ncbi:MAG TPA: hypothetical protein PLM96_01980, partial [Methanoregulaceae archaeon]|nr:hypothetical protein [Methanoregulaceae archaeon]HPQ75405.1 hypothetical protein [Methanoregulaceae archaeon]
GVISPEEGPESGKGLICPGDIPVSVNGDGLAAETEVVKAKNASATASKNAYFLLIRHLDCSFYQVRRDTSSSCTTGIDPLLPDIRYLTSAVYKPDSGGCDGENSWIIILYLSKCKEECENFYRMNW